MKNVSHRVAIAMSLLLLAGLARADEDTRPTLVIEEVTVSEDSDHVSSSAAQKVPTAEVEQAVAKAASKVARVFRNGNAPSEPDYRLATEVIPGGTNLFVAVVLRDNATKKMVGRSLERVLNRKDLAKVAEKAANEVLAKLPVRKG